MTERPFVLLTQDDCPSCERLKKMLAGPLKGQFDGQIEVVHRQHHPEAFSWWAQQHRIQSVPALLRRDGEVMRGTGGLGEVRGFLQQIGP